MYNPKKNYRMKKRPIRKKKLKEKEYKKKSMINGWLNIKKKNKLNKMQQNKKKE